MSTDKSKYEDDIFKIPFDKVKLPSEGKLYTNIGDVVDVEYLVTEDEDTLYSSSLMENGQVFNKLVEDKLKTEGIKVEDLLIGDFNQILVFLRKSAYGNIYKAKTFDPDIREIITQEVDLDKLKIQGFGAEFDENGEFDFVLPVMNKRITFKLLTVGLGDYINNTAEKNKVNGVTPYLTTKFETQIMSVEGKREKFYISKFVKIMSPKDRISLSNYIDKVEPKVNLDYTFLSSVKNNEYTEKLTLGFNFFYPGELE